MVKPVQIIKCVFVIKKEDNYQFRFLKRTNEYIKT